MAPFAFFLRQMHGVTAAVLLGALVVSWEYNNNNVVSVDAFYLPGVHPQNFDVGEHVPLKVGRLVSTRTTVPYEYYKLPMCVPAKVSSPLANLGEVLTGDVLYTSPYKMQMQLNETCQTTCTIRNFHKKGAGSKLWKKLVEERYHATMRMDNMPVVELTESAPASEGAVGGTQGRLVTGVTSSDGVHKSMFAGGLGLPLGARILPNGRLHISDEFEEGTDPQDVIQNAGKADYAVFNHINFSIFYHPLPKSRYSVYANGIRVQDHRTLEDPNAEVFDGYTARIVGIYATIESVKGGCKKKMGNPSEVNVQKWNDKDGVTFSYSVNWIPSETNWASRWDALLSMSAHDIDTNWYTIANSLLMTCLTFLVAAVIVRSLRRDLLKYEEIEEMLEGLNEEAGGGLLTTHEDFGWKLVAHDVFRPPKQSTLLCVLYGAGMQLFYVICITISLGAVGFLNPSNRGVLLSTWLFSFSVLSYCAGNKSAWLYQALHKNPIEKRRVAMQSAWLVPGAAMVVFCISNTILWIEGSSGAVPFGTFFVLFALWFIVSVPLTFLGSTVAYRKEPEDFAISHKQNAIPRMIPEMPYYRSGTMMIMVGALLPFLVSFAQAFFVVSRLLLNKFVYMFGFITAVFLIVMAVIAETGIVITYWCLNAEDYRWWWRSYMTCFTSGIYTFIALLFYFLIGFDYSTNFVNMMVLTGHMLLASLVYSLVAGAVGFRVSLAFVGAIYDAIKAD
ncbi:hypothetical protein PPROV_000786600 [Pycnococcus provasolii]|uniref:Transmembrane 9 superfamily member n=1 Tax=Pycnococcus provasolii TaxID=41880 RepID=A0A830HW77_9CHLO|nr:hypothetical protein PPROV_000786600 [Pycnococcus provasolii]